MDDEAIGLFRHVDSCFRHLVVFNSDILLQLETCAMTGFHASAALPWPISRYACRVIVTAALHLEAKDGLSTNP